MFDSEHALGVLTGKNFLWNDDRCMFFNEGFRPEQDVHIHLMEGNEGPCKQTRV